MNSPGILRIRVVYELLRYDLLFALRGLKGVRPPSTCPASDDPATCRLAATICEAFDDVTPLYWKPVRCLQRSIVLVRLIRSCGVAAQLVIGYQSIPFFSHAWVEIGHTVVGDSPVYKRRLLVMERL